MYVFNGYMFLIHMHPKKLIRPRFKQKIYLIIFSDRLSLAVNIKKLNISIYFIHFFRILKEKKRIIEIIFAEYLR